MFLESMTWKEVQARILDSMDFLNRNTVRNFSEWQKNVKRLRPLPLRFQKTVKNGHKDEFLLLGCSEDGKRLATGIYAISNTTKGKEFIKVDIDPYDDFPRDRVTSHFLKRYRERCLHTDEDYSPEKLMSIYFLNNAMRVLVYNDPKNPDSVVFATKQGLILANIDRKKGYMYYGTYLDDADLNVTQRMAKEKIMARLPEEFDNKDGEYYKIILSDMADIVQDIYAKYNESASDYLVFRKTNGAEEVNLDFKLSADKKTIEKNKIKQKKNEPKAIMPSVAMFDSPLTDRYTLNHRDLAKMKMEVIGERDGKGKMYFYDDGRRVIEYKGDLRGGLPEGNGKMKTREGDIYEGIFHNGELDGHAIHTLPGGKEYEDGVFKGFKKNGYFHCHYEQFDAWSMYIDDEQTGNVKLQCKEFTFEGELKGNGISGNAKVTFADGEIHEGRFRNYKLHGKGKKIKTDGTTIIATFDHNVPVGHGMITYADGTILEGDFDEGELDGMVKKTLPDGTVTEVEYFWGEEVDEDDNIILDEGDIEVIEE